MHFSVVEDLLLSIAILSGLVLLIMAGLRKLHQPYLIAYIFVGVLIGPYCLKIFTEAEDIMLLGELGILLHMFFLGTEVEVPDSKTEFAKPVIAQGVKMLFGGAIAIGMAWWLGWSLPVAFILFCILIFNSTAIASEYLKRTQGINSTLGRTTLNILVLQDLLFGPVLILFQALYNNQEYFYKVPLAVCGCIFVMWIFRFARERRRLDFPFVETLKSDHEMQIFFGFAICTAFALLSSYAALTASFGAFIAGVFISRVNNLTWLDHILKPFYTFFMCLFFLAIGLAVDIPFVLNNLMSILVLSSAIILVNSFISMLGFRLLEYKWSDSFFAGALMAQIGEYSLLINGMAYHSGIISAFIYKHVIAACCISTLLSTLWITIMRAFIFKRQSFIREYSQNLKNLLLRILYCLKHPIRNN